MNEWKRLINEIQWTNAPTYRRNMPQRTKYTDDLLRDIYDAFTYYFGDCYDYDDFLDLTNQPMSRDEYMRLRKYARKRQKTLLKSGKFRTLFQIMCR